MRLTVARANIHDLFVNDYMRFECLAAHLEALERVCVELGAEVDVAASLGELGLHWSDGELKVGASWEGAAALGERVTSAMLHALRCVRFTESRWLSVGAACRPFGCVIVRRRGPIGVGHS